jgi:hypothetical protein
MADITMCGGKGCPIKSKCKRYNAKPDPYRQSWGTYTYDKKKKKCVDFLKYKQ